MASPTKSPAKEHSKKPADETNPPINNKSRSGDAEGGTAAVGQAAGDASSQDKDAVADAAKKDKEFEEASAVVARHVRLLREYNEMKDVGQQLMGLVAENRGVTVGSLYETGEFGVGPKD
ncbi:duf1337 domain-containing protein [Colletotrichum karsti]|uniref:Duf1337 domain-containing protein n=1 Tax=Colletotrichum karsti TaxID=1095194 RepID=A0A9P6LF13_9PEZI|nr:duf1337 domain-containing protein [Colletotrichum karsti]KAF9869837.1 duf1337 domain-containing protein [Colletotrichum karsti]